MNMRNLALLGVVLFLLIPADALDPRRVDFPHAPDAGRRRRAMGFGKSKAKLLTEAHGRVTFEDVAGVDEAKEDLEEIVEFLRDPQSSSASAARSRAACCWSARRAPVRP
jgi:cell division protease FtsH